MVRNQNPDEKAFGKVNIVTFMRTLSYRILLRKEPEGGYTVLVPSLPGCITYGKTVEDAIEMAKDAIKGYVESLVEEGEEVPVEEDLIECRLTVEAHA
ncbi:MAG TPA: type II toxin-antitoxin system HicB family antitoxin [Methanotrichaceae archaeon]|nr:type II toxin-antitoxin system HicB family antitoxin [Methanotrichaceae archaeon]